MKEQKDQVEKQQPKPTDAQEAGRHSQAGQGASSQSGQQSTQAAKTNGEQAGQQRGMTQRESFFSQGGENPFAMMRRLSDEMDRFMGRMFENFGFGREPEFQGMWSPQVEVCQRDNNLIVCADLPGLKKDEINVEFTDQALIFRGERRSDHEDTQEGYHRSERSYGSFYRSIPLPEGVNPEEAKATFENGELRIALPMPRQEKPRSRRIEIQSAGSQQSVEMNR